MGAAGPRLRVLGIDPGTRLCGWGVVDCDAGRISHVDNGVIVVIDEPTLGQRLALLFDAIDGVIERLGPDVTAVEGVFHSRNARSALLLGHGRGVAMAAAARRGLAIHEYAPSQVKKAICGTGRADKEQVQKMVSLRLGLVEVPQVDAADAVAVALCHAQHSAFPSGPSSAERPRRPSARAGLEALVAAQQKRGGRGSPRGG